ATTTQTGPPGASSQATFGIGIKPVGVGPGVTRRAPLAALRGGVATYRAWTSTPMVAAQTAKTATAATAGIQLAGGLPAAKARPSLERNSGDGVPLRASSALRSSRSSGFTAPPPAPIPAAAPRAPDAHAGVRRPPSTRAPSPPRKSACRGGSTARGRAGGEA